MDQHAHRTGLARIQKPPQRRLSEVLSEMATSLDGPVSVGLIRDTLGDRSVAALLVFFAGINLLPLPPGTSLVLGLPLLILAIQMVSGSTRVWLPRRILDRTFTADQFRALMGRLVPWLRWLEDWVKPRLWPFWPGQGDRILGLVVLLMAVSVVLPIPLGNWLPAFCATLIGLALMERDGVMLGAALLVGVVAMGVVAAVVGSAGFVVDFVWASMTS